VLAVQAEKRKNPYMIFEALHQKVSDLECLGDLDVSGRLAAVKAPTKWLTDMSSKVMGWRQGASLTDIVAEVTAQCETFKKARREMLQDQGFMFSSGV
jgi:hypothetical protein